MTKELKKIKEGINFLSLGTLVSNVFLFIKAILLVRYFGAENYGLLSLVLGLPILLELIIVNTDYYLVYRLPREIIKGETGSDDRASLIICSYIVKSLSVIFTSFILYFFSEEIATTIGYGNLISAIEIVAVVNLFKIIRGPLNIAVFNQFQKYSHSMISDFIDKLGYLLVAVISVSLNYSIEEYLILSIFAIVPVSIYNNFQLLIRRDYYLGKSFNIDLSKDLKEMITYSIPNTFRRQLDRYHGIIIRYIIGYLLNASSVGIITFVYNIYDLIWAVCLNGQKVFITSLSKDHRKDVFLRRIKKILLNFNFLMIIAFFAMILFAHNIVSIIGGNEFLAGSDLLKNLSFSIYFVQLSIVIGTYLVFYNLNYTYFFIQLSKALFILSISAYIVYLTKEMTLLPWITNIAMFSELVLITIIAVNGLKVRLSKNERLYIFASLMIITFSYFVTTSIEATITYEEIWSLGSISTRVITFLALTSFTYIFHLKSEDFVIRFRNKFT